MVKSEIKILFIEDDEGDAVLTREMLLDHDSHIFLVEHVSSISEGLALLINYSFDVVLMDLGLPESQGLESLYRIHAAAGNIPVVILSGVDDEHLALQAIRQGAHDYLVKGKINSASVSRVIQYVNERAKIETTLKQSEERFRTLALKSVDAILVADLEGIILYANPSAETMLGVETEKFIGTPFGITASLDQVSEVDINRGLNCGGIAEIRSTEITWSGTPARLITMRDITERKHLEEELKNTLHYLKESQEQLIQTEKLGALGILTAGIAHEINNPMMGILNFIQYSLNKTNSGCQIYSVLKDAERETMRCIGIIENLLTFSRTGLNDDNPFEEIDVAVVFDRVLRLLSYRINKEEVHIINKIPDDMNILTRSDKLQQVILNLLVNALDAINTADKKQIIISAIRSGEYLKASITDTGSGIPEEIMPRIFDPFFTTKPVGKGTGLGLSVCRNIINEIGGSISCESRPGEKTEFSIFLPENQISRQITFRKHPA